MLKPTAHRIPKACDVPAADGRVSIAAAALINPAGPDKGLEGVAILNITPDPIGLSGGKQSDGNKNKMPLSGVLIAGQTMMVKLPKRALSFPTTVASSPYWTAKA